MDNPDPVSTHHFDDIENKLDLIRGMIDLKHSRGVILREMNSLLSLLHSKFQPLYTEAIFTEFYPVYLKLLTSFKVFGSPPAYSRRVLLNAKKLFRISSGVFKNPELAAEIKRITVEMKSLNRILSGEMYEAVDVRKNPVFPVIESVEGSSVFTYLDSIEVKVVPAKGENRFMVHPTYKDEDVLLVEQARSSLAAALAMISEKKNLPGAFEVQVFFNSRLGIYSGNSFGALLTVLIYFEINKLIKPNEINRITPSVAFTGAVSESGEVLSVGKVNIVRKVRSVFFSGDSRFVVPKADEHPALSTVAKMKEKWPGRRLEIIGVNTVPEILNRRDIVAISRKPLKQRVKEWARKYRYASLVLIPVLVLLGFMYVREFDSNPVSFGLDGTNLLIKNKYGGVLWSWTVGKNIERDMNVNDLNTRIMISDINEDGGNEVIFSDELLIHKDPQVERVLLCLNSDQEEVWRFSMQDTLSSPKESNIPPEFSIKIFDTVTINNSKRILLWTNSVPTYPSAIITIDPRTGKRFPGTIWNAGFIQQVAVEDIDDDQDEEIIFMAVDNGLKIQKIVACEFTDREYMLDTRADYFLNGKLLIQPIFEISLPNTDYTTRIKKNRDIFFDRQIRMDNDGRLKFFSRYHHSRESVMYTLVLKTKTLEIDYFIEGAFRDHRDSLVNAGKLPLPYTDTKEYTDILKNGVRYKLDGKWVTYQEYVTAGKVKALPSKKE